MKVLLVDAAPDRLDATAAALRREGVVAAADGAQALRRWDADRPDAAVLAVGLPRVDGLDLCRRIRRSGPRANAPVLLLAARAADEDAAAGFRAGADDVVLPPVSPAQLAARLRAVWRRAAPGARPAPGAPDGRRPAGPRAAGDLVLDPEAHEVRRGGAVVRLTPTEFRLLELLAANAGRTVRAARLVEHACGHARGYDRSDASLLKSHVSHLRAKLRLGRGAPGAPGAPGAAEIRAVPRVGYRLVLPSPTG